MNNHCEKSIESVKTLNKKLTLDSLLDLCDDYDLTPAEVDWVTNQLSNFITDNEDDQNDENSKSTQHESYVDFTDYSSVQTLDVDGLTDLPDYYLSKNSDVVSIKIPDGVKSIGNYCFSECPNLDTVVFPKSLKSIQGGSFRLCPNLRRFVFLGDLPESVPSVPNVLVVYGSSKKSSSLVPPKDALVILMKESINKWLHGFDNFAVIRGFMYATESGVFFADKIIKETNEYISKYREQLFYYSVVRHDRIILRYLIDYNMLPQKVLSSTLDILLYNDYREAIEKRTQIVSDYWEIHKQDTESLKSEWAYKFDSKKRNAMIVQFKGAAVDCVYVPSMINDCPVTCICSAAFSPMNWNRKLVYEDVEMRYNIQRIILPETVKKIDADAFDHCEYSTIYIPESVESIDPQAFGSASLRNRYRLIVQNDSYAEQYAIANEMPYFHEHPEYSQMVTFVIVRKTKKGEESLFQNDLEITLRKDDITPFRNSTIRAYADGYGMIGTVASSTTAGDLFARQLIEKFFCKDTSHLNYIIEDNMSARIIEAYSDCAVCVLMKK